MAITTYGDVLPRQAAFVAATALEHVQPILVLSKFADTKPIPMNHGK